MWTADYSWCGARATGVIFRLLSKIVLQQQLAGVGLWHEIRNARVDVRGLRL